MGHTLLDLDYPGRDRYLRFDRWVSWPKRATQRDGRILRHPTILLLVEINSGVFIELPIIELSNMLLNFHYLQHRFLGLNYCCCGETL